MHQGDVVENVDPHLAEVFAGRVFEKVLVRRTEFSASPIIAVCITMISFHIAYGRTHERVQDNDFRDRRRNLM